MFTSYVMPEAQLHISDLPDKTGDYPVTFKVYRVGGSLPPLSLPLTQYAVTSSAGLRSHNSLSKVPFACPPKPSASPAVSPPMGRVGPL